MAKYHATELAVRASGLAVQLLGAAGYMEDHPTEQWYRDAKQLTIVEGTCQVQLGLIARGVLDGTCGGTDAMPITFAAMGGWPGVLGRLVAGGSLDGRRGRGASWTRSSTARPRRPRSPPSLAALRVKGETVEEMTGLVRAMLRPRRAARRRGRPARHLSAPAATAAPRINVSTIAAFVVAGAGAGCASTATGPPRPRWARPTCSRRWGWSSTSGPAGVARCVDEAGMGFCFAPRFHPAMRFAGPVRKELGVPTVFNFLGPLANPARARHQLVGVSDPAMAPKMAGVLGANGVRRAMVVHADDGLDELSVISPSTVFEVSGDGEGAHEVREWRLDPVALGSRRRPWTTCGAATPPSTPR